MKSFHFLFFVALASCACNGMEKRAAETPKPAPEAASVPVILAEAKETIDSITAIEDTVQTETIPPPVLLENDTIQLPPAQQVNTANVHPDSLVRFAQTLQGTPYLYASTDPAKGFDCSGFITYVFNHFRIAVPRSSVDFTNVGATVSVAKAQRGDLILFTGTDSTIRVVGHMGIVVENSDSLRFIHSSSGKAHGVVITPLNKYYQGRFVRIARIFPERFFK